jgi:hypothetical protein
VGLPVSVSERFYAAVHAKYLAENVGKKVAYLYTTDGAGISFAKQYMEYMKKTYNVDPVYEAQMQETDLDFRSHLLKIKSLNPEVLAIGDSWTRSPVSPSSRMKSAFRRAWCAWPRRPRVMRRCRGSPATPRSA